MLDLEGWEWELAGQAAGCNISKVWVRSGWDLDLTVLGGGSSRWDIGCAVPLTLLFPVGCWRSAGCPCPWGPRGGGAALRGCLGLAADLLRSDGTRVALPRTAAAGQIPRLQGGGLRRAGPPARQGAAARPLGRCEGSGQCGCESCACSRKYA